MHYLRTYPLSILLIFIISYLSFFKPPETPMEEIPYIDKAVHICMYGGLTFVLWVEYLLRHRNISYTRIIIGGILAPICMSGLFEILQSTCTENRSGDWMDLIANITGVCLGALFCFFVMKPKLEKRKRKKQQG